jgi:hypothetical protein
MASGFAFTVEFHHMPISLTNARPALAAIFTAAFATTLAASSPAYAGDLDCPCLGDLDASGAVDAADLAILLGEWSEEGPLADLNFNKVIDAEDLAILLGAWGDCPTIPINDNCPTPIVAGGFGVEIPFCTLNTQTSLAAPQACDLGGNLQHDVFYRFTATQAGRYRAKVYDATFDARAIVYSAPTIQSVCSAAQGSQVVLGCTADGIPEYLLPALDGHYVEFDLAANQSIMVRVGSPSGAVGYGTLMVERVQPGWSPCEPLEMWTAGGGGGTEIGGFSKFYPQLVTQGCYTGSVAPVIWYTFESACSQSFDLRISTCQGFTSMDCVIAVFVGSCGDLFEVACDDDTCVSDDNYLTEEIVLQDCTPNTKYYVRLMPYPGAELGQFGMNFQVIGTCP